MKKKKHTKKVKSKIKSYYIGYYQYSDMRKPLLFIHRIDRFASEDEAIHHAMVNEPHEMKQIRASNLIEAKRMYLEACNIKENSNEESNAL